MPELRPIYRERDFYVPAFEVKVGGDDLPKETLRDIISVRYSDKLGEFDKFEITVNNWDAEKRDFKYTGSTRGTVDRERDERFDPGKEIELFMGYFKPPRGTERSQNESATMQLMLTGVITGLAPTFPASGQPTVKISGRSVLMKLITIQKTKTYPAGLRDSAIAKKVGERGDMTLGGVTVKVKINPNFKSEETEHPEPVVQGNQYDIVFLLGLAHRNGYDLVLEKKERNGVTIQELYFGPSTQEPPFIYLLEWGKSLVQFQPTLTIANQVNELTVRGWDAQRREVISETVRRADLRTRPLHDLDRLRSIEQGFSERHEIIVDRPFRNRGEARRYALGQLGNLSRNLVRTQGTTIGMPSLRVGRKIEVRGLGRTFDGQYFIESTTHTIGSGGYTTEFDGRLEENN